MNGWAPFEAIVAARFLREGRLQTLFIIGGIAIGVGVIIFMSVLLKGLQANFIRRVLTAQAHVQLVPPKDVARVLRPERATDRIASSIVQAPLQRVRSIDQWQAVMDTIRSLPETLVVTPEAAGSVLLARGAASRSVTITGIDPDAYFRVVAIPDKLVAGPGRLTSSDMLVGLDLAIDLGIEIGDKLRVVSGTGASAVLVVTGIFDLGNKGANQRIAYVALHTAQALLGLPGGVSAIDVTVRDVYDAEAVAQRITQLTGVEADSWIATNGQFFSAVQAQTTANTTIRFFVGLSVAFGIASVLVVSVVQKSREIGILRAMGASRGQILRIFLLEGGVLGLLGAAAGSALGALALVLWQGYVRNPDGTSLIPVVIEPGFFVIALAMATLTGVLSAALPASRAARLDPVAAIRG